jgi:C-terminal peptidase prc
VLLLAALGLAAGCTLLGGPSPILPLPTPQTTSTPRPGAPTPAPPGVTPEPTFVPLNTSQRDILFEAVWRTVRDEYVYTDYRGLDWQAVHDEYQPQIENAATTAEVYRLLAQMIEKLGDRHSSFMDPQEVEQDDALQRGDLHLSGIGVFSQEIADAVRAVYIIPGSPADHAGLKPFDIIRAVNGTPLTSNEDAPHLIRGPAGTPVTLTIESPGRGTRNVTIVRGNVTFAFHASAQRLPGSNVVYLNIPSFLAQGIAAEARAELERVAEAGPVDGLIIDLRQNGGGFLSELSDTEKLFLDGGNGGYEVTRDGRTPDSIPSGQTLPAYRDKPIVVLVSNLSESAAERFASAMQNRRRATVLGTTSAGNTETVYYHDLPYGSRLGLAQATYEQPDGTSIEDKGVIPDVVVDVAWYEHALADDPQVLAAKQQILSK